ncbi:MAG: ATP-binding protein [Roseiflexaceae bacterium]
MQPHLVTSTQNHTIRNLTLIRRSRYHAQDIELSLYDVPLKARRAIRKLYRHLVELTYLLRPWLDNPDFPTTMAEKRLRTFVLTAKWSQMISALQDVTPTQTQLDSARVHRVIHDLRGGALSSLSLYLQLAESGDLHAQDIPHMVLLANDHAKMLRTAISDLDRIRYTRDELFLPQQIDTIVHHWRNVLYRIDTGQSAHVTCESHVSGYIADSVIELAALERVLYNLVNNAVRHTPDYHVKVNIMYDSCLQDCIRFSVSNKLTSSQIELLSQLTADTPHRLILTPITTTGSGLGLGICADIVAHVFQADVDEIIRQQYFTVSWDTGEFHVDFVWPRVNLP